MLAAGLLGGACLAGNAKAQTESPGQTETPGATTPDFSGALPDTPGLTEAQLEAARTAQAIYNRLRDDGEAGLLPADQQALFDEMEELVHTANDQQGIVGEPTDRSLQLDLEGLADALQWVANEEVGAQGSMATDSAFGQMANIAARLGALRLGGGGFRLAGRERERTVHSLASAGHPPRGGAAGADDLLNRWGVFVNGSYGVAERDPSGREDAFEAKQYSVTAGVDYRFPMGLVLGAAAGITGADVEFDSAQSVVDGDIQADAYSGSLFGLYYLGDFHVSGIFTYGLIDYEMVRRITYPSNNPLVPPTNETALSDTEGRQILLGLTAGYEWSWRGLTLGPLARLDYLDASIDGYTERNANAFNLEVSDQDIESLVSALGFELSYAVSTPVGVLLPQVRLEWNHEFQDDAREVTAQFAADPFNTDLVALTDEPDRNFYSYAIGLSATLPLGIQGFVNYEGVIGRDEVDSRQITAGGRWEF